MIGIQTEGQMPDEVARQLDAMLFGVPRSTAAYLTGLVALPELLWEQTHDVWITIIALAAVVLNFVRVLIVVFKRRQEGDSLPRIYWAALFALGMIYSADMAALALRALWLRDPLALALAAIAVAGYLTGVVIRASAVPRLAVPQILALFVPMIAAAPFASSEMSLAAAALLFLFCIGCLELSRSVHDRMKAQLIAEHKLAMNARTDYLTGLANRAAFDERGGDRLRQAEAGSPGPIVALIDLDGFKNVNDTHGHAVGDEVLRQASGRLRQALHGRHFAARLGGDECAVVFDLDAPLETARSLGEDIVATLARPFELDGVVIRISGSVGIAALDAHDVGFASVVERADRSLYAAKQAGGNQVRLAGEPVEAPSIVPAKPYPENRGVVGPASRSEAQRSGHAFARPDRNVEDEALEVPPTS